MLNRSLLLALIALIVEAGAYTEIEVKPFMFKTIDPIVLPGLYSSHMHTFVGSDGITAHTTKSADLRNGCTTAANPNDMSTYWVPSLLVTPPGGIQGYIFPDRFSAYYENLEYAEIPFPEDFKMLAGVRTATTQAETDPNAAISWYCGGGSQNKDGQNAGDFPHATCSDHLQHLLHFPDCVDPNNTASYGYSSGSNKAANRCAEGMQRIPKLRFSILYNLRGVLPNGWSGPPPLSLSSGNSYSAHGDFFFGWDTTAAQNMAANKLDPPGASPDTFAQVDGGMGKGSLGQPKCNATDRDEGNGTPPSKIYPPGN